MFLACCEVATVASRLGPLPTVSAAMVAAEVPRARSFAINSALSTSLIRSPYRRGIDGSYVDIARIVENRTRSRAGRGCWRRDLAWFRAIEKRTLSDITDDSSHADSALSPEQRRRLAADLFNRVWTLLGTPDRSPEQDDELIHTAHASRYHWGEMGTPANLGRGEWQISRVYATLGRAEPALHHARRCLVYIEQGIGTEEWDLPFAFEALARAHGVAGDSFESRRFEQLAREAGELISDPESVDMLLADLSTLPGR